MVSFWSQLGIILMSFLCLAVIWRPGAPQGTPPREPSRKSDEKVGSWVLRGPSPGPLLKPTSVTNRKKNVAETTLKNIVRKVLQKRSPGPPQTMKAMVSPMQNHYFQNFHLYLQNDRKLYPMAAFLAPFGFQNVEKWRSGKRSKKGAAKRSAKVLRGDPPAPRATPVLP